MLTNKDSLSPTYLNEMGHIKTNFERALGTSFPKDLPLLLFVVAENKQTLSGSSCAIARPRAAPWRLSLVTTISTKLTRGRSLRGVGNWR